MKNAASSYRSMVCFIALVSLVVLGPGAVEAEVKVVKDEKVIRVLFDGELFTEYHHEGRAKPLLYPVYGPGGAPMTRNYPFKKVEGEASDHPHHESLWYTHGDVNGISFWHKGGDTGAILTDEVEAKAEGGKAVIQSKNNWVAKNGEGDIVCTDTRTVTMQQLPGGDRVIDFDITIHASHGEVTFGDTKEGSMGIRTHPSLRLSGGKGVKNANGQAINSEGVTGKSVWGKRAKWVDYWGEIDGKTLGVAIFDHPGNPRHPTWWHARHYGLVAANPFGIHDFERKGKGAGDMKLAKGESVRFRYRFLFHAGDVKAANIAERYQEYAKQK